MADKKSNLEITLALIDKASAPLVAFNKRVADIAKPVQTLNNRLALFGKEAGFAKIGERAKGVSEAFGEVANQAKDLALKTVVGVGLIGGALFGLVKSTADFGDRTDELANKAGVSAQAFQEMAYAAKFSSIDAETLATTLAKMNKNIVAAVTGNKEMATWFKRAGLSIADLKRLKPDQVFDRVLAKIDQFNKAGNSIKANGLATGILGKGGADLIPAADGFDDLRKKAEQLGIVMSDDAVKAAAAFNDKFDETATVIKGVGFLVGGILMPQVQRAVEAIEEWTLKNRDLIASKVTEWVKDFSDALPEIIKNVKELFGYFAGKAKLLWEVVEAVGGVKNALMILGAVKLLPLIGSIISLTTAVLALNLAFLANPITWIVAGIVLVIGGLIAIGYLLWKNWDKIIAGLAAGWNYLADVNIKAWDAITAAFSAAWQAAKSGAQKGWGAIEDFFSGLWDRIKATFDSGVKYITDKLSSINPMNLLGGFNFSGLFGGAPSLAAPVGVGGATLGAPAGVGPLAAQTGGAPQNQTVTQNAKVTVDFANAPPGTTATPDRSNRTDVDINMGYAMGGAL